MSRAEGGKGPGSPLYIARPDSYKGMSLNGKRSQPNEGESYLPREQRIKTAGPGEK